MKMIADAADPARAARMRAGASDVDIYTLELISKTNPDSCDKYASPLPTVLQTTDVRRDNHDVLNDAVRNLNHRLLTLRLS